MRQNASECIKLIKPTEKHIFEMKKKEPSECVRMRQNASECVRMRQSFGGTNRMRHNAS